MIQAVDLINLVQEAIPLGAAIILAELIAIGMSTIAFELIQIAQRIFQVILFKHRLINLLNPIHYSIRVRHLIFNGFDGSLFTL